jgi:tetratricopeptide (TPR) repeat protein
MKKSSSIIVIIGLCFYLIVVLFSVAFAADAPSSKASDEAQLLEWTNIIKAHPNEAVPYFKRGAGYFLTGQYDLAINDFSQAIELNPKYAVAYLSRGWSYDKKQQYDLSLMDYNKAIALDASNEIAYTSRAEIYIRTKQYDLAIADCDASLALNPKRVRAYLLKGMAFEKKIMYQEAIDMYRKVITIASPQETGIIAIAKGNIRALGGEF